MSDQSLIHDDQHAISAGDDDQKDETSSSEPTETPARPAKKRRGFAVMDPKRVSEIASKGGKAAKPRAKPASQDHALPYRRCIRHLSGFREGFPAGAYLVHPPAVHLQHFESPAPKDNPISDARHAS